MKILKGKLVFLATLQLILSLNTNLICGTSFFDLDQDGEGSFEDESSSDYEQQSLFTIYEDDDTRERDGEDEVKKIQREEEYCSGERNQLDSKSKQRGVCMSKECVIAAGHMLAMMNQSADPCKNFYNYVCGNFKLRHEPFEDMARTMSFELLRRQNSYIMNNVLQKLPLKTGTEAVDNLKKLYDSCISSQHKERENIEAIKTIVKKYGPWPLTQRKWNSKSWNFKKTFNKIYTNVGAWPLFYLSVELDYKDPDKHAFKLQQSGLPIPREYFLSKDHHKKEVRRAHYRLMMNVMKYFGFNQDFQKSMLRDVYMFERELAKIFISSTELRKPDLMYKKFSIKQLNSLIPEIDLPQLLETWVRLADYKLTDIKYVIVTGASYFKNLGKLVRKTKKETIANYLMWNIISRLYTFGGEKFRDERFKFLKIYSGIKARTPFWLSCTATAETAMPFAYGRIYVDKRFRSKYAKKEVKRIVGELKNSFISNLKTVKWMSKKTKEKAKEKAKAINDLIAYPDFILDNKKLGQKYEGLHMKGDDFLANILDLDKFNLIGNIRLLNEKRNRGRWSSSPAIVNAFYSQAYNRIVFPAGILQPFYYHHEYPSSMKYGGIGTVIGHEITHAFDDLGRKYDKHGRLVQWWNPKDIKKFEKEADCIRKQYSSYSVYGKHMNGKLSCGENIADNGGVKIAYQAFRRHLKKYPNTKALPGLQHLSDDQLFYISFAKIWCAIEAKARTLQNIVQDHHSYPKFRVLGSLSNSQEFSKAFECKVGTPMNPMKKCKIW